VPRYENFIKVALGLFLAAAVFGGLGIVGGNGLLTVLGGVLLAIAWVLLFAGLVAGALRPMVEVARRDFAAQLADIAALHEAGKLSDEEFARAKRRCLES
jgi:hypothetical protein